MSIEFPDGGYENVTDPPPTFPTNTPSPDASMGGSYGTNDPAFPAANNSGWQTNYDAVSQFYRSALGRDPESSAAVNGWLSGMGGDLGRIQQAIYSTPEAQAYGARRTASVPAYSAPASTPSGGGGASGGASVQDF